MSIVPWPSAVLRASGPQRRFSGDQLQEIAFPLGGIGTGCISLGGRGNLRDIEIFNKPNKNTWLPFTFFALHVRPVEGGGMARILEGRLRPPYRNGFGEPQAQLQGLPRFQNAEFTGTYPTAHLNLSDPEVPVTAQLQAWNPFIPLDVDASSLPVAMFEWTIANPTNGLVEVTLAACLTNPCTAPKPEGGRTAAGSINDWFNEHGRKGYLLHHPQAPADDADTGTMCLCTEWPDTEGLSHWYRGGWWDGAHLFWDAFTATGRPEGPQEGEPAPQNGETATLLMHATIPAGGFVTIPVVMSWLWPWMANPWQAPEAPPVPLLRTWAGARFENAKAAANTFLDQLCTLRSYTDAWRDALYASSLPARVSEAVGSQVSILRSPTCMLLDDRLFVAWEGCGDNFGCCMGSCTHVWNYEQTLAFLFPTLERSMRVTEFLHNTRESGNMAFRSYLPPGNGLMNFKPCADGQMGAIMQVYRDWQLSGDTEFLRSIWPQVKRALEYAWTMTPDRMERTSEGQIIDSLWDPDGDGVMEGEQHNTYDIEFFGPNTLCTVMYLGALRAATLMAESLGEHETAAVYDAKYRSGRDRVDQTLFNGEFYVQQVHVIPEVTIPAHLASPSPVSCACRNNGQVRETPLPAGTVYPKYQYGAGCLADQLLGQWAAHVYNLGYLLDPDHVRSAVKSIYTYNTRYPMGAFPNVQRVYALPEESALLLCTWPHGDRPALPFVYSDEAWTGIEFQVAAHLIYEGYVDEGLAVVQAVTDRYSGHNRNPWNHVECGHHYARALASWSVKLALDGFGYSAIDGWMRFAPRIRTPEWTTFWSTGSAWGRYAQAPEEGRFWLEVTCGELTLNRLELADLPQGALSARCGDTVLRAERHDTMVVFRPALTVLPGSALHIHIDRR